MPPATAAGLAGVGEVLLRDGLITKDQLAAAIREQKQNGTGVGYNLVKLGHLPELELVKVLARQHRMPAVDLSKFEVDPKIAKQIIGVFDTDWSGATADVPRTEVGDLLNLPAKKVAKRVVKELNLVPAVEQVLDRALEKKGDLQMESKEVIEGVREAMHEEVHAAVTQALHELVTAAAAEEPAEGMKNGN